MNFEKRLLLKIIAILFLGIIPFTIAFDCDILINSLSYLKGDIYNEIANQSNCCDASGITCNASNQITAIDLNNYNLSDADFKSAIKELAGLPLLNSLRLFNNNITGSIPPEIGQLKNLQYLYLEDNLLSGSIPPEIGQLNKLEAINFARNLLTGIIPPEIGKLTNMMSLSLNINQLTGSIPPEIGQLNNLQYLYLQYNKLTGTIPQEIINLTKLELLNLSHNQLSKSNSPEIEAFTSNIDFDFSGQSAPVNFTLSETNSEPKPKPKNFLIIVIIILSIIMVLIIIPAIIYFIKLRKDEMDKTKNGNGQQTFIYAIKCNESPPTYEEAVNQIILS